MKLIVGLGNPGKEYTNTRHNVGFIFLDEYVNNLPWKKQDNFMIATNVIKGEKIVFLKPLTYMNLSGNAVAKVVNFYKISPCDMLVIRDDLDLESGKIKFKYNSSSGGHNGIQNIIDCLSTKEFAQLKIGIGKSNSIETKDYVLGKLSSDEIKNIQIMANDVLNYYLYNGLEKTMGYYNQK